MDEMQKAPQLQSRMQSADPTGTLELFWKEQVLYYGFLLVNHCGHHPLCPQAARLAESKSTKRKRWNPIVLRFLLELWEEIGEKHFRKLEDKNILVLPSKRQLVRYRSKTPLKSGCEPETYRMLRKVVRCVACANGFGCWLIHTNTTTR